MNRTRIIAIEWQLVGDSQKYRGCVGWVPVYLISVDAMICLYARGSAKRPRGAD